MSVVNADHENESLSRRELAEFLRSRREKLTPELVGLPKGTRRRTPGLRREEVAELAGVGTTWYTWLEQARDIQPSVEVLRRLSKALLLSPAELRHMFALAGKAAPAEVEISPELIPDSIQRLVDHAIGVPALILGKRWDVIGGNELGKDVFQVVFDRPAHDRNWLDFIFRAQISRENLEAWESNARRLIAEFRASVSDQFDNPWVVEVVDRLKVESPEFEHWWREHDVRENSSVTVRFQHPDLGPLQFERTLLQTTENFKIKILIFNPVRDDG